MNLKEIKIFDAYSVTDKDRNYYYDLGLSDSNIFEYHNAILRKNGTIKPNNSCNNYLKAIKPLDDNIKITTKWELDEVEKELLAMLKNSAKKAKDVYDSCERKYNRYQRILFNSLALDTELYEGKFRNCNLSPFGKCVYKRNQYNEFICVFCGLLEEKN